MRHGRTSDETLFFYWLDGGTKQDLAAGREWRGLGDGRRSADIRRKPVDILIRRVTSSVSITSRFAQKPKYGDETCW